MKPISLKDVIDVSNENRKVYIKATREVLRSIYSAWHGCALGEEEILPKGTLCDECNESIKNYLEDIFGKVKE